MTALTAARTRATTLTADASAAPNARWFVRHQLADWGLTEPQLGADACAGVTELVVWALANDAQRVLEAMSG